MNMKRKIFFFVSSIMLSSISFGASYNFDAKSSEIKWLGKKVSGSHDGIVKLKSGVMTLEKSKASGTFEIDMTTITDLDMSGKWKEKLENHLKSEDFFNVAKYPTSTFNLNKVDSLGSGKYKFYGDLTIKGIKKPVQFPATFAKNGAKSSLKAKFTINRLDWDVKYNSGKFFDVKKLGDKMIYDDIEIELNLHTK